MVESPTRYVPASAYAHAGPIAAAPAPLRASSAAASWPLRDQAAPSLHALHYASGVRAYGAHLDLPPRASKAAPRGPLRQAQGAACHVLCVRRRAPPARLRSGSPSASSGLHGSVGSQGVPRGQPSRYKISTCIATWLADIGEDSGQPLN